jgi:tetratricopeptide (TPR) repeat protein
LAGLTAYYGRRSKTLAFTSLYFLITLLPVLQIVPVGSVFAADRYFYLPSFGLCFAAGEIFSQLAKAASAPRSWTRILAPLAIAALLVVFVGISRERIRVWRDSFSLWNDVLAKDPNSYMAFGYRGMAHAAAGAYEPAMADFQRALDLGGNRRFSAEVYFNRGALQQGRRLFLEALADYDRALLVDPGAVRVLVNRGNVLDTLGRPEEALRDYNRGLSLEPENALLYYNRALVHHRAGNAPQAILDYGEALKRDPWFAPAYENRARAYAAVGDRRRAEMDRDRARALAGGAPGLQGRTPQ